MNPAYTIIKPKDKIYKDVERRLLGGRSFTCGICDNKCLLLTDKSIVTNDVDSPFIHVLNYCPRCEQRIPIRFDLVDDTICAKFPEWEDVDGIYPKKRED